MFKTEFPIFYFENLSAAFFCLVISFLYFGFLIRRQVYSIFDPAFFFFLLSASGYSLVLLLWYKDEISDYYFYCFMFSQTIFYLGWNVFKPRWHKSNIAMINIDAFSIPLYYISVVLFFSIQLLVYKMMGLPIFMDSRLDAFSGGGGIGLLDRFLFIATIFSFTFASFRLLNKKNKHFIDILVVFFFFFTKIVSGSKASILEGVFLIGLVFIFLARNCQYKYIEDGLRNKLIVFVLSAIPIALLVTAIQQSSEVGEATGPMLFLLKLALRFVNTGDIYYLSWVDDYASYISDSGGLIALFSDFLGASRLMSRSELPVHFGFAIMLEHTTTENTIGPNARFNVFGLHYFGFLGVMFYSLALGMMIGFVRNYLLQIIPRNMSGLMIYVMFAYMALFVEQDFHSMTLKYLLNFIFYVFTLFPLIYTISRFRKKKHV